MEHEYVGELVRLRPLADNDLDAVLMLYRSTPNYVAATGAGRDPISKLQLQAYAQEARRTDGRTLFAVLRCSDQALVGIADVQLQSTISDTGRIALLLIGGPYQQQGYGSAAADLLETALFGEPEIEFVMAGVPETSPLGQRFWQCRGYHPSGSTTHDPQTSRTTIWLAKPRPAPTA